MMPQKTMNNEVNVTLQYFASMREERGLEEETLSVEVESLGELYDQLQAEHGFFLKRRKLKVAVNDIFVSWDQAPREGDLIVFIPPVGGG
jgi:molybdopterin converting factor subunit 1